MYVGTDYGIELAIHFPNIGMCRSAQLQLKAELRHLGHQGSLMTVLHRCNPPGPALGYGEVLTVVSRASTVPGLEVPHSSGPRRMGELCHWCLFV